MCWCDRRAASRRPLTNASQPCRVFEGNSGLSSVVEPLARATATWPCLSCPPAWTRRAARRAVYEPGCDPRTALGRPATNSWTSSTTPSERALSMRRRCAAGRLEQGWLTDQLGSTETSLVCCRTLLNRERCPRDRVAPAYCNGACPPRTTVRGGHGEAGGIRLHWC